MTPEMDFSTLDAISGGDVSPLEARGIVRRLLNSDAPAEAGERIYAALREVTFQALVSRAFSGEIVEWFEVFKQVAALLRSRGLEGIAERLRVLSDMAGQAARFAEAHPIDEVLNRRHVRALLQALLAKAGTAYRADIAKELNIGEANLSRIISNLVVAGLVERRAAGRQAELRLTELAKEKLAAAKPKSLSGDFRLDCRVF
jgi:DNA-binding MarR family transcriptional regulator